MDNMCKTYIANTTIPPFFLQKFIKDTVSPPQELGLVMTFDVFSQNNRDFEQLMRVCEAGRVQENVEDFDRLKAADYSFPSGITSRQYVLKEKRGGKEGKKEKRKRE